MIKIQSAIRMYLDSKLVKQEFGIGSNEKNQVYDAQPVHEEGMMYQDDQEPIDGTYSNP